MKSDLIDIAVTLHHETERALLVSDDGDCNMAVWIPKSSCEIEKHRNRKDVWTLTLPERLALEKGFI